VPGTLIRLTNGFVLKRGIVACFAKTCPLESQMRNINLPILQTRKIIATAKSIRLFPVVLAAAIASLGSADLRAQTAKAPARVAVLNPFSPPEPGFEAFRGALRGLGYVEGQNLSFEIRWANGQLERLPDLARELVVFNPNVIFAPGEQGLRAAKEATATTNTPIVVVACDPLDQLIKSLARPGGSATGLSCIHSELAGKRVEMLKELVPTLARIAVLFNPSDPNKRLEFGQVKDAGQRLGIAARDFEVTNAEDIDQAFSAIAADRVQAVIVLVDAFTIFHRKKLADLALQRRLPAAFGFKEFVEAGGLLSYGANRSVLFSRAATYVDQILKGAKPGDLPVEEPTIFELYINGKTASTLGLTIPPTLMVRADKVLE
jgi:putative ABC transport system substrate-binding protein